MGASLQFCFNNLNETMLDFAAKQNIYGYSSFANIKDLKEFPVAPHSKKCEAKLSQVCGCSVQKPPPNNLSKLK